MCLILFAWQLHPVYRLVLGANRDEFYERPTLPAGFWADKPELLAGKDLKEGGTWMGITKSGRFAAITNYRDLKRLKETAISRGHLVADFLKGTSSPEKYMHQIENEADKYNGFNVFVGQRKSLFYFSNIEKKVRELEPGIYGISNHLLNTAWPKVISGKLKMTNLLNSQTISTSEILDIMSDETTAPDQALPDTGVGIELERMLSSMFIKSKGYGTRCSTAILIDHSGNVIFEEKTFSAKPNENITQIFNFKVSPD